MLKYAPTKDKQRKTRALAYISWNCPELPLCLRAATSFACMFPSSIWLATFFFFFCFWENCHFYSYWILAMFSADISLRVMSLSDNKLCAKRHCRCQLCLLWFSGARKPFYAKTFLTSALYFHSFRPQKHHN